MEKITNEIFYAGFAAIEKSIQSGSNTESLIIKFNEQTNNWQTNDIIDYIKFIYKQQYTGSAWDKGHEVFRSFKGDLDFKLEMLKLNAPTPPPHFTVSFTPEQLKQLYTRLIEGGFLPTDTTGTDFKAFCYIFGKGDAKDFKPLMWIKTNSTTHGKTLSKKSLLDLLDLLKIPFTEITDKSLLNKLFYKPDGTSIKFTGSNYTDTQLNFNSEYHNQLQKIVDIN